MHMIRKFIMVMLSIAAIVINGCSGPQIKLFSDETEPLQEFVLEGKAADKVLLLPIRGLISDEPRREFLRPKASMLQETVSQLKRAEKDKNIRAVVLKIDSPGGATTASDILYHEILAYKKKTDVKIIVSMMDVAASGAYYISLPADYIIAHPTTVTGSIGVIFLYPRIDGLMEKIGLTVEVSKSGKNKDMASPFRVPTAEERKMIQQITQTLGNRFIDLVTENRKLDPTSIDQIATARIFLPEEALRLGLIDEIGYLSDAVARAKSMTALPDDAKVVVYRRTKYPEDNFYNTSASAHDIQKASLVDLAIPGNLSQMRTGFYYLWLPSGAE